MTDQTEPEETTDATKEPRPAAGEAEAGAGSPAATADEPHAAAQDEAEVVDRQTRRDERWRDRARTAEERADRLVTREVLRLLGQRVADAQVALAMSGETVTDLLTDDGDVDEQSVADLAARVLGSHPALAPKNHHMDLGPKRSLPQRNSPSWDRLVRGK